MSNQYNGLATTTALASHEFKRKQRLCGQYDCNPILENPAHREGVSANKIDKIVEWPEDLSVLTGSKSGERPVDADVKASRSLPQPVDATWESAAIAHELRQPLSAIVSNAEACLRWLTRENPDESAARESIKRVIRDARAAAELMEGIRSLCRGAKPRKDLVELNAAIADVLCGTRERIEEKGIRAEAHAPTEPIYIFADRVQFQQVLHNLILNAIEAMEEIEPSQRVLSVQSFPREDETVLVTVEDTGCGVTDFEHLFDPLVSTKKDGLGIGLWICQSIIESHDGRLWAERVRNGGTRFSFLIPVHSM